MEYSAHLYSWYSIYIVWPHLILVVKESLMWSAIKTWMHLLGLGIIRENVFELNKGVLQKRNSFVAYVGDPVETFVGGRENFH